MKIICRLEDVGFIVIAAITYNNAINRKAMSFLFLHLNYPLSILALVIT